MYILTLYYLSYFVFFLMIRRPPRSTRTDTLFPLLDALPISRRSCFPRMFVAWTRRLGRESNKPSSRASHIRGSALSKLTPQRAHAMASALCGRSEEHTSELQSLMRISYAVFCLKKKN